MKRFLICILAAVLLFAVTACASSSEKAESKASASPSQSASASASGTAVSDDRHQESAQTPEDEESPEEGEPQLSFRTLYGLNYAVWSDWPEQTTVFDTGTTSAFDTGTGTFIVNAVLMDENGAEFAGQIETATAEENSALGLAPVDVPGAVSAWEVAPSQTTDSNVQTLAVTIFSTSYVYTVSYSTDQAESEQAQKEWETALANLSVTSDNETEEINQDGVGQAVVIGADESAAEEEEGAPQSDAIPDQPVLEDMNGEGNDYSAMEVPSAE